MQRHRCSYSVHRANQTERQIKTDEVLHPYIGQYDYKIYVLVYLEHNTISTVRSRVGGGLSLSGLHTGRF